MIIERIEMRNFRQFIGVQTLEFAYGADGNVTVVFGENGRGKTGIYRALLFCLYGVKQLMQDAHVDEKELYLVNTTQMEQNAESKKPVKASVKVCIKHECKTYQIERSLLGYMDNGEVLQEDTGVKLFICDEVGNTTVIKDSTEIDEIVNAILDKSLREYFLFDGEKIERLTRASSEQRKEISNGIRKLLEIDVLETAKKATGRLRKYLNKEIETRATGELARVFRELRQCEERIESLEEECAEIERDTAIAEKELVSADEKLSEIQEIRSLLEERVEREEERDSLSQEIDDLLKDMKEHTAKTASLLVKATTHSVFKCIDAQKKKHELPSEIRRDLIERLLDEGVCICGCKLEPGSDEYEKILHWKNRSTDSDTENSMLDLWRYLSRDHNYYSDIDIETKSVLHKYALTVGNLRKVNHALETLGERIGTSERPDATRIEKYRKGIVEGIAAKNYLFRRKKEELKQSIDQREQLQARQKECEKERGIVAELASRSELAESTHQALEEIYEEFTGEARDEISTSATEFFQELLDEEGRQTLSDISVDRDYKVQVFDRWRKPFLANISAGQRQIMSIAFIASLAQAASVSGVLEMPWFMDTPFGRLSREHRRNLIEKVPNWCSQWILLATDTEFGRYESNILDRTGQWTKFYVLKGAGPGSTSIEKLSVASARQLLKEEAGE